MEVLAHGGRPRARGVRERGRLAFYERALETAGRVRDLPDVELASTWRALGEVREAAGHYRRAIEALRSATRLYEGEPVTQAEIYEARALAWTRLGSFSTALRETTTGSQRSRRSTSPRRDTPRTTCGRCARRSTSSRGAHATRSPSPRAS